MFLPFKFGLMCLASLSIAQVQAPVQDPVNERAELYAWLDSLGYREQVAKPFVTVEVWREGANGERRFERPEHGFLVEDSGGLGTVLSLSLVRLATRGPIPVWGPHYRAIGSDLRVWAGKMLEQSNPSSQVLSNPLGSSEWPPRLLELAVASYACAIRGWDDLSGTLFAQAKRSVAPSEGRPLPLVSLIKAEIAEEELADIIDGINDNTIPLPTLVAQIRQFRSRFPNFKSLREGEGVLAKEIEETLGLMIQEDEEHGNKPAVPLDHLSVRDRVAELIYRLRDARPDMIMSPGGMLFAGLDRKSPVAQLLKIGLDAVPQLIDALGNKGFVRIGRALRYQVRIRDVVREILGRIAHKGSFVMLDSNDATFEKLKYDARRWYESMVNDGERQVLIDVVRDGGWGAPNNARVLAQKFPADAVAAISAGIRANPSRADKLIAALEEVNSLEARALIEEQLKTGTSRALRFEAAKLLVPYDLDTAVDSMILEFDRSSSSGDWEFDENELIRFLAASGRPRAIAALADRQGKRPASVRLAILKPFLYGGLPPQMDVHPRRNALPGSSEYSAAVERLLISAISDDDAVETQMFWSDSSGSGSFWNPQVREVAAYALSRTFPEKYPYATSNSPFDSRLRYARIVNTWRKGQGLPLVDEPRRPIVKSAPAKVIDPLLTAALKGTEERQNKALREIQRLGLPALRAVLSALDREDPYSEAHSRLAATARRLSCVVREVEIVGAPPEAKGFAKFVGKLEGEVLSSERLVTLLQTAVRSWKPSFGTISISAERDNDGSGILLKVSFAGRHLDPPLKGSGCSKSLSIGGAWLVRVVSSFVQAANPEQLEAFGRVVRRAEEYGPLQVLRIGFVFKGGS